jgi:endonuclease/exonuclease/phosphatase family metal-dependent hydrolase
MRVMVWNVWGRSGGNWRQREDSIAATLATYRPDVLGLVESWSGEGTDQPSRLAAPSGMHATWAPTSLPPTGEDEVDLGIGLVSRWPIVAAERHDLPNEQRGGPAPSALLVTVDHPRAPLHVIVSCTEWEPHYAEDHRAQCRRLATLAADPRLDGPLPVLLLADLNADPDQPELIPLLNAMLDTWTEAGADPRAVTLDPALPHAPREATKQINRRVDHVLARPGRPGLSVTVTGAFLAGDRPIDGFYPSDHYAVGVDMEP